MSKLSNTVCLATLVLALLVGGAAASADSHEASMPDHEAMIQEALSAATPEIAENATVMGWDMKVVREGTNGWTCMPTPPHLTAGVSPMCIDEVWMEWAGAYLNKTPYAGGKFGMSYMLAGDAGASNIDPYAEGPTDDNQWIVEGPHLMILVPDKAVLEGIPTDPSNGGPYVMWAGTDYVHIMVPVNSEKK